MSSDISTVFPTFCHISELGSLGYGNLHRMLAISSPLNLWAPSSALLRHPGCKITPDEFMRYVRQGNIRVIARREWLIDRRKRDAHPWEGARWDPDVDGQLRAIMEEDEAAGIPRAQRRVVAAGPEGGWQYAKNYISDNPDGVRAWESVLRMHDRDGGLIPPGTFEAAQRKAHEDPKNGALLAVLRDAFNHGAAIGESDAEIPILLRPEDREFLKLMTEIQDGQKLSSDEYGGQQPPLAVQADIAELTYKMIEVLQKIETDRTQLHKFVGSPEQDDLLRWVGAVCGRIKIRGIEAASIDVGHELAEQLRRGRFSGIRITELRRPLEATEATATGLDLAIAARAFWSCDHLGIIGFLAAAFSIGYGLSKKMGWVPGSFSGPRWPFLYAGTGSSQRTQDVIAEQLDPQSAGELD